MALRNLEKYEAIKCLNQSNENVAQALILYHQRFPERNQISAKTLKRFKDNLIRYGAYKKPRPKLYESYTNKNEIIEEIIGHTTAEPETSVREIQTTTNISKSSVQRVLKKNGCKPYKIRKVHTLHPRDSEKRQNFCNWYLEKLRDNRDFYKDIIWTDEVHVSSAGIFNRNNKRFWSFENPHQIIGDRVQQGRFGFNAWCAIKNNRVLCYYIRENNLNSEGYLSILRENLEEALDNLPLNQRNRVYYQQDGASIHNAHQVRNYLNENFENQWIGTFGPIRWPPRSPDMTPLDFFLWGHVKHLLYQNIPRTLIELKRKFRNIIENIAPVQIMNATRSIQHRCNLCLDNGGNQFEHLM